MASSNDFVYGLVREVTPGVTPATPAFQILECLAGSDLSVEAKVVTSDTMKANRALAAATLMNKATGNGLKMHAHRDATVEMLIEGILGNTFSSNVAKGGSNDYSFTIEKRVPEKKSGVTVDGFHRYTGQYVTKWGITVDAGSNAEFTFDFVGMNKSEGNAIITGATYVTPTMGQYYNGATLGAISIAGVTGDYQSLDFSVEQPRETRFALNKLNAAGVNASAQPRSVKLMVKVYREDIAIDALAGTVVPVSLTFGNGTGNVLTIACPKMLVSVPADEVSGSSAVVALTLTAINDSTLGSDISVTRG